MPTLGKFIQRRRLELGLTQEQLAEMIGGGVRQSEISRLEHDRVVLPRRQRLEQIARALDVSLGELLARSGWAGAEESFDHDDDVVTEHHAVAGEHGTMPPEVAAERIVAVAQELSEVVARAEQLIAESEEIVEQAHLAHESGAPAPVQKRTTDDPAAG